MQKGYTIIFKKSALKELLSLPNETIIAIEEKIDSLSYKPRPPGYKRLKGSVSDFRIRVGNYRVVYSITDNVLTVF